MKKYSLVILAAILLLLSACAGNGPDVSVLEYRVDQLETQVADLDVEPVVTIIVPTSLPTAIIEPTATDDAGSEGCWPNLVATVLPGRTSAVAYTFAPSDSERIDDPILLPEVLTGFSQGAVFCIYDDPHTGAYGKVYYPIVGYVTENFGIGLWVMEEQIVIWR
jgi:hypothetical protein